MTPLEWILLGLILFAPWLEGGATPAALAILHTGILALAVVAIVSAGRRGRVEMHLTWSHLAWLAFVAVGGISLLGASYAYGAFDTWWDQCIVLILMGALALVRPGDTFRRAAPAAIAALGVAQAIPAIVTRAAEGAAISPSFLNPNHLAAWLNVSALIGMERAGWLPGSGAEARPRGRAAWVASTLICVAGTLAVGSRGGLLSLVAILAILAVRGRRPSPRVARGLAAAALVVAAAGALSIGHRFTSKLDPYLYDRPRLWRTAVETWAESPLLGHGPGMYEHRSLRHNFPQERAAFHYSKEPRSAHSQPLQVLAEEGLAGLAALAVFAAVALAELASAARGGGERSRAARTAILACAVVGLHSLVEMPFQAPAIPIALVVMGWLALSPARAGEGAAAITARRPTGPGFPGGRRAVDLAVASVASSIFMVAVAGPFLSYAAARYAEAPGRPPIRVDLASRLAERMNPLQPFPGYRRAEAALSRATVVTPPLLANAMDSLERTIRLAPDDPSAHALLASLYRRAAEDLPGAGAGAVAEAGRLHDEAVARAPLDARLLLERAAFRLQRDRADGALADADAAVRLEPRSPMARHLRAEALFALGRTREAASALADLDGIAAAMAGYEPLNGYERSLLRLNRPRVDQLRSRLADY